MRELEAEEAEARELRRRAADWEFIESQPEPLRTALRVLVETGDMRLAAGIAGLGLEEFNELRLRARVPLVL